MGLLEFQSPLSILGLKFEEKSNKDAIKQAYKRATLHCHPDKRHNDIVPRNYFYLLNDARDWLDRGDSVDNFKGYPVIFFPRADNIGRPTVFKIPTSAQFTVCECGEILTESSKKCDAPGCEQSIKKDFMVCNACKTPIPVHGYNVHFAGHGHEVCSICKKVANKDHYQVYHPEAICLLCDKVNLDGHIKSHAIDSCATCLSTLDKGDDFVNHVCKDHCACPLCTQECGDDFQEHLYYIHYLVWDELCIGCSDEDLSHYLSFHEWLQCPFPNCELHIAKGKLLKHAKAEHHFKQCQACPMTEKGFSEDKIHAQAHERAFCTACMETFESYTLPNHQVSKHHWLLCTYCNRAEESEEMLQVHIKEDHSLVDCSICQQQQLREKINSHLVDNHGWMKCSWCNEAFTEEELRSHITESHPPQESCACGYKDTIPNLKLHRINSHDWQQCPHCKNIEPADQFGQHIGKHQLMACQECEISILPENKRAHFQETHHYVQCPFCENFDSRDDMLRHMPIHLDQSGLPSLVPNLDLPISKFQGTLGQSPEEAPVRQHQVVKRKQSVYKTYKCNSCRHRKMQCTFGSSENTCDQCLRSSVTCPGASHTRKRLKDLV